MAEYISNDVQEVQANQNVVLYDSIPCNKGYVYHRNGSGIITLKGVVNNAYANFARYQVTFNGNIAVPTDGTAGEIAIALSLGGEILQTSKGIVTPTVVDSYFNVTSTAIINVPRGCCFTLAVENASEGAINVQNANLVINRVA